MFSILPLWRTGLLLVIYKLLRIWYTVFLNKKKYLCKDYSINPRFNEERKEKRNLPILSYLLFMDFSNITWYLAERQCSVNWKTECNINSILLANVIARVVTNSDHYVSVLSTLSIVRCNNEDIIMAMLCRVVFNYFALCNFLLFHYVISLCYITWVKIKFSILFFYFPMNRDEKSEVFNLHFCFRILRSIQFN